MKTIDSLLNLENLRVKQEVELPYSKSISNRSLMIQALSGGKATVAHLSNAGDTKVLQEALNSGEYLIDAGPAGTAMRFLTAYFSVTEGERVLTGSERMQQRPIGILVDALRSLGASIKYMGKEGCPPLRISGRKLSGGTIELDTSVSSQYVSALMMVAPVMAKGLTIRFRGERASAPYIAMTASLMHEAGAKVVLQPETARIDGTGYQQCTLPAERDWSAASCFFEYAAFDKTSGICLNGLKEESLQGDKVLVDIFSNFGVQASFDEKGCHLSNHGKVVGHFNYDFTDCPDLAQAVAVTMAALGIGGKLTGLKSLRVKETDRIEALKTELGKLNIHVEAGADYLILKGGPASNPSSAFLTYDDHRMAMAFAPLATIFSGVAIDSPAVVEKSFPGFWHQFH